MTDEEEEGEEEEGSTFCLVDCPFGCLLDEVGGVAGGRRWRIKMRIKDENVMKRESLFCRGMVVMVVFIRESR